MNKGDLRESNRRGSFYWDKDGKPYISVTTILSVIAKPQIQTWYGKEVYRAMVVDPTLSEKDALAAPYNTSKSAMSRGTTIHSIVETYKHTKKYLENVSDAFKPYAQAFYTWVEDNDVEILENEKTVVSKKYGYAGTLDLLIKFRKKGRILIADVKTGKDIYDEHFLQLSAYKQALFEMEKIDTGMGIILLSTGTDGKGTGKYKFQENDYYFDEFMAARKLWIWKNQGLIASVKKHMAAKKASAPKPGVKVESAEEEQIEIVEGGE